MLARRASTVPSLDRGVRPVPRRREHFRCLRRPGCLVGIGLLVCFPWLPRATLRADEAVTFETHIAPLLQQRCVRCHGDGKLEAGLDVRRKSTLVAGGDSGPALVAGQPGQSLLWQRIEAGEMPPADAGTLDDGQKRLIRRWIESGAPLAGSTEPPLAVDARPSRLTPTDRQHWSFLPPVHHPLPATAPSPRVRTPVDAWLADRWQSRGLAFNPDAERRELLRRLQFDLCGLPPTWEQWEEFRDDPAPDAYERLVDRLLASPRYGERWGRRWLDIAGYADSDGYLAADRLRPEAWRYRDYVIQAHNSDLPYDEFLQEQLAGDELSDWRRAAELTPLQQRQLVATGFLRTASDPTYPGYTEPNEIHQVLSDTLQIFGSTFLGLTVQCARCHAHKFDPLSQRDYYALQAIFLPALDPARWQPSEVRGIPAGTETEQARVRERLQKADERLAYLKTQLTELTERARRQRILDWLDRTAVASGRSPATREALLAALLKEASQRTPEQQQLLAAAGSVPVLTEAELAAGDSDYRDELARLKAAVEAEQAVRRPLVNLRGLCELDGPLPAGRILRRGDHDKPGATVEPGVPEVLVPPGWQLPVEPLYKSSGRRLALARWLTTPDHPLTARVAVNRVWSGHFGHPLVRTPANLGRAGTPPTHPELLDWLALELPRRHWSLKSLHRLLVTSTVFRQSAAVSDLQRQQDPANELWSAWTPRRHEGEVVRDSVLAVAERLNLAAGGPPVPVQPQGDGSVLTGNDAASHRRSIYLIVRRSQHLTLLDLFDTPVMEVNCPERTVSTVPLQALALLHGPFLTQNAQALGERLSGAGGTDDERIVAAVRRVLTRDPTDTERQRLGAFLADVRRALLAVQPPPSDAQRTAAEQAAWTQLALVLLNENAFLYE